MSPKRSRAPQDVLDASAYRWREARRRGIVPKMLLGDLRVDEPGLEVPHDFAPIGHAVDVLIGGDVV